MSGNSQRPSLLQKAGETVILNVRVFACFTEEETSAKLGSIKVLGSMNNESVQTSCSAARCSLTTQ